ncbi:unnamed protein product [Adineta steineri]|uniref:Uncharacterized protein n=1 Tax=Adineta steineri TaxID=433720 RepID=A0A816AGG9_9BILA|nr:unnamed protein product [Adineta steineri]CAF1595873.1 unnamed protein product [Adineta steineri]
MTNIILIINNQCGLQTLLDYILYLCIQLNEVNHIVLKSNSIYTDSNKQLNSTFKTQLLNTDESISHTFTTDCFPLKKIELHKSRHVMKLNLLDYFYSIFFGKKSIVSF